MRVEEKKKNLPKLELNVGIYNIYGGANPDLLSRSRSLSSYEELVERYDRHYAVTRDRAEALRLTVAECRELGIQEELIELFAKGIENMIFTKFNLKDAKEVWQEEAENRGMKKGVKEGMAQGVAEERLKNAKAMKADGVDVNTIAKWTGMTLKEFAKL